jgi:hypothetical protein
VNAHARGKESLILRVLPNNANLLQEHQRERVVRTPRAVVVLCVAQLLLSAGCAFPPPVQVSLASLLENPHQYVHQRLEVSGTVEWHVNMRQDFAYWHFHLKSGDADIVCYSEAYKHQVWSMIDHVIRRAATEKKELTVTGYLVGWGSGRSVLRAKLITYGGHTYDAELIPPAVPVGI